MSRDSFTFDARQNDHSGDRETGRRTASRPRIPIEQSRELPERVGVDIQPNRAPRPAREDTPRPYSLGDRTFLLRESELETLADVGTFRVVAAADLARFVYGGDSARMEREIRRLKQQRLVVDRILPTSGRKSIRVVGLTKTGKRLLRRTHRVPETQALYHGIVKVREAKHDAELYRLFRAERARLEIAGSRGLRIILDDEIKRDLNRERARLGDRQHDPEEIERLAEAHGLTVVNGKIPLPDLRIEYQTPDFELQRVDLELATRHYRPRGVAEKAKAGFALYSPREDAPRLRRILDERELTARIFAL
jgi:hypothetical protein